MKFKKTAGLALVTLLASIIGCASTTGPAPLRGADVAAPDRAPALKAYGEKNSRRRPATADRTHLCWPAAHGAA